MIHKTLAALCLCLIIGIAGAAETAVDGPKMQNIKATVAQINPDAKISWIKPSPLAGLSEVGVDGVVLYISDDGRYLLHGTLLDVLNRKNLTEIAGAETRKQLLAQIKPADKIIYRPKGQVKHTIVVFTDISCGYCHKLHEQIQGFLDRGIQVEYVPFPRGGTQSPALSQMERIWCSKDRNAAYDAAVAGNPTAGAPGACANPVSELYELGDKLGIQGTPAVFTYDGLQHGGFVMPEALLEDLAPGRAVGDPETSSAAVSD